MEEQHLGVTRGILHKIQPQHPSPDAPKDGKKMQIEQWMGNKRKKRHSEMVTGELVIEKHANRTKEWSVKMIWGRRGSIYSVYSIFYSEVLYTLFPTRWHYDALKTKVVLLFSQYYIDQNHLEISRNLRNHHQDCRQGF